VNIQINVTSPETRTTVLPDAGDCTIFFIRLDKTQECNRQMDRQICPGYLEWSRVQVNAGEKSVEKVTNSKFT